MAVDYSHVLTATEARAYLPSGLEGVASLTDAQLNVARDYACGEFEAVTGIMLRPLVVRTMPDYDGLVQGVDYDEVGRRLTWRPHPTYGQYSRITLPRNNIIEITQVRGILRGVPHVTYPLEWVIPNLKTGYFDIVPAGDADISYLFVGSLNIYQNQARWARMIPGYWAVDYSYGLQKDDLTADILGWIGKKAAIAALGNIPLASAKSSSTSQDGVSKSTSYDSAIDTLTKELGFYGDPKALIIAIKYAHKGFKVCST